MEKLELLTLIRCRTEETFKYLLSVQEGRNDEVFAKILDFYLPDAKDILDLTAGKGMFYRKVKDKNITQCDVRPLPNVNIIADATKPLIFSDNSYDVIVIDPPYQHRAGKKSVFRERYGKIPNQQALEKFFQDKELYRVLRPKGILIIKIMDIIETSKPNWNHVKIMNWLPSFYLDDLIIYWFTKTFMRAWNWNRMKHAKKVHAYFMIFRKRKKKVDSNVPKT